MIRLDMARTGRRGMAFCPFLMTAAAGMGGWMDGWILVAAVIVDKKAAALMTVHTRRHLPPRNHPLPAWRSCHMLTGHLDCPS